MRGQESLRPLRPVQPMRCGRRSSVEEVCGTTLGSGSAVQALRPVRAKEGMRTMRPVRGQEGLQSLQPLRGQEGLQSLQSLRRQEGLQPVQSVCGKEALRAVFPVRSQEGLRAVRPVQPLRAGSGGRDYRRRSQGCLQLRAAQDDAGVSQGGHAPGQRLYQVA